MSQRYSDNTKRPKPKENQLGILKIYAFFRKIPQRALGPGESCYWGYEAIYENTPKKLLHLPQKVAATLLSGPRKAWLEHSSHLVKVGVEATC